MITLGHSLSQGDKQKLQRMRNRGVAEKYNTAINHILNAPIGKVRCNEHGTGRVNELIIDGNTYWPQYRKDTCQVVFLHVRDERDENVGYEYIEFTPAEIVSRHGVKELI